MKSLKTVVGAAIVVSAVLFAAAPRPASAQIPVITYYSPPVTLYAPVVPEVVYQPTTVFSVPTTVFSAPAPVLYQPPQANVVYRPGPLGLFAWPDVYYTPGYYFSPAPTVAFPTPGVVYYAP